MWCIHVHLTDISYTRLIFLFEGNLKTRKLVCYTYYCSGHSDRYVHTNLSECDGGGGGGGGGGKLVIFKVISLFCFLDAQLRTYI